MRIECIEVENFKGFDKRRFEFDEHFTLIVGENGTGKTSLMEALSLILETWVNSVSSRITHISTQCIRMTGKMTGPSVVIAPALPLRMSVSVSGLSQPVKVSFSVTSEADQELQSALRPVFGVLHGESQHLFGSEGSIAPLCVSYFASRRFDAVEEPDLNKALSRLPKRTDGYLNSQNPATSAQALTEWLVRWQAISEEDKTEPAIFKTTREAIIRAIPDLKQIRFSTKRGQAVVERTSGEVVEFSRLSDGQKSVLAMVGDMARRCALLNPHLEDPISETPGVVLIDEIDLHLHPRWQRRIIDDLRRAFPKIQFIATTHSPIIISAAKDARIIQLDAAGSHDIPQAYGMDVNWVVDVVQGAESQASEVVDLVGQANDFIDEGKLEEARAIAGKLEGIQNGPSPDSVGIVARIENLIALADAED